MLLKILPTLDRSVMHNYVLLDGKNSLKSIYFSPFLVTGVIDSLQTCAYMIVPLTVLSNLDHRYYHESVRFSQPYLPYFSK